MRADEKIIAHVLAALMSRISQERGGPTVIPAEVTATLREAPGQPDYTACTVSVGKDLREPCMRALRDAGAIGVADYNAGGGRIGVSSQFATPRSER